MKLQVIMDKTTGDLYVLHKSAYTWIIELNYFEYDESFDGILVSEFDEYEILGDL